MADAKGKIYDAFADLDATGPGGRQGGRGENSGWLKCPLCPPSSKKRFAKGRGFAAHLRSIHAPDPQICTHEEAKAWSERAAQVVREAEQNCVEFAEGRTRIGKVATSYVDSLPEGLLAAKMGDLAKLRLLVREGWNPCLTGQKWCHCRALGGWKWALGVSCFFARLERKKFGST